MTRRAFVAFGEDGKPIAYSPDAEVRAVGDDTIEVTLFPDDFPMGEYPPLPMPTIVATVQEVDRLAAENARLRAELERVTGERDTARLAATVGRVHGW